MSLSDLAALLPFLILGLASILSLLSSAFLKKPRVSFSWCMIGSFAALVFFSVYWRSPPGRVSILVMDGFSLYAICLILIASIITAASAFGFLRRRPQERGEYFFLLTLASLGASILAAAGNFAALFLGLELLSVSLFTLISYTRERPAAGESGIKYLILAGVSSAFLLFGMALVYLDLGTMNLSRIADAIPARGGLLLTTGLGLMTVGIGFKLAVVPFHFWTPDIYEGAPTHVAGFLATVSKGAVAVILVRLFGAGGIDIASPLGICFAVISVATMFAGNLLALRERGVKRILAFSSITHLGYLLVAFVAGGLASVVAVSFFLAAYFASTLTAFASVTVISGDRESDGIDEYRGLARSRPWLAGCFALSLLSLAGLPLTSGFMGKLILFTASEGAFLWVLAGLLAVNSTISLFYYLKLISAMYQSESEKGEAIAAEAGAAEGGSAEAVAAAPEFPAPVVPAAGGSVVPWLSALIIALSALAVLALGIYPDWLIRIIELSSRV